MPSFIAKAPAERALVPGGHGGDVVPAAVGVGHADGDDRVLEGVVDAMDRRLQDALRERVPLISRITALTTAICSLRSRSAAKAIEFATAIESWPAKRVRYSRSSWTKGGAPGRRVALSTPKSGGLVLLVVHERART
jgi:hypothetical protein